MIKRRPYELFILIAFLFNSPLTATIIRVVRIGFGSAIKGLYIGSIKEVIT